MDKLEEHLNKLKEFDLSFEKKEMGHYLLTYRNFNFELVKKNNALFLKTELAPCPKENKEALFAYLMKVNLLGQNSYGNVIGLEPDEKNLTLICPLPYVIIYKELKEKIELFLSLKEFWTKEIDKFGQNS